MENTFLSKDDVLWGIKYNYLRCIFLNTYN